MNEAALLRAAEAFAQPFYAETHRAYHNAAHVTAMLEALASRGVLTPTLALATWAHDLIYDPRRSDNEERSAEVFGEWLTAQGAPLNLVQAVKALILTTKHTLPPATRDEALLIDADLSILGAEPEAFAAYDRSIGREYRDVPGLLYRTGRQKVLRSFLERERIYTTPEFTELEAPARANLTAALEALTGKRRG